jgi:hypothetical protein
LKHSIERIHQHNPVVNSNTLIKEGISPGPSMGQLLREAERISINQQLHTSEPIIQQLKASPLWPPH